MLELEEVEELVRFMRGGPDILAELVAGNSVSLSDTGVLNAVDLNTLFGLIAQLEERIHGHLLELWLDLLADDLAESPLIGVV